MCKYYQASRLYYDKTVTSRSFSNWTESYVSHNVFIPWLFRYSVLSPTWDNSLTAFVYLFIAYLFYLFLWQWKRSFDRQRRAKAFKIGKFDGEEAAKARLYACILMRLLLIKPTIFQACKEYEASIVKISQIL